MVLACPSLVSQDELFSLLNLFRLSRNSYWLPEQVRPFLFCGKLVQAGLVILFPLDKLGI